MVIKNKESGVKIFEVGRFDKNKDKDMKTEEKTVFGMIKNIAMPVSFIFDNGKKLINNEINFQFSFIQPEKDHTEEIKKQFRKLYKYGKYAPNTHLIPLAPEKREKMDRYFMGIDTYKMRYGITNGELPATATIGETIEFFPCYNDVLPMMLEHFQKPDFFITLLQDTAVLNVKYLPNSYGRMPLEHVHGECCGEFGHPHIRIFDDATRKIAYLSQIEWAKLKFEYN